MCERVIPSTSSTIGLRCGRTRKRERISERRPGNAPIATLALPIRSHCCIAVPQAVPSFLLHGPHPTILSWQAERPKTDKNAQRLEEQHARREERRRRTEELRRASTTHRKEQEALQAQQQQSQGGSNAPAGAWRPDPSGSSKIDALPTPHGVISHAGASRPSASRRDSDRDTGRERVDGSRGAAVGSRPGSRALLSQGGQEAKVSHGHGREKASGLGLSRDSGHHLADLSLAALPQGTRRQATAATGNSSARRTAQGVLTNSEYLAHKSRQLGGPGGGASGGPRVTSLKPMPLPRKPTSRERHRERDFLAPRRESGLSSGLSASQSRRP